MTNIAGARVERGAILVVVGLVTKTKVQARCGKWKNGRGRVLQVYAAKSNEEKQCNVQRDENGRKTSDEKL